MNRIILSALLLSACSTTLPTPVFSVADLEAYAVSGRFTTGTARTIKLLAGGETALFVRSPPEVKGGDLWELDVDSGVEKKLLTAATVFTGAASAMSPEEKARRERTRTRTKGISQYSVAADGDQILVPLSGRLFVVQRQSGAVMELPADGGYPIDARFSPDGKRVAVVRGRDLFVIDVAAGTQRQLTRSISEDIQFGTAEFVAQEEMRRQHGYWWAPDSSALVVQRTDNAPVETLWIHNAATPDGAPRKQKYPRAGTDNAIVSLQLVPLGDGEPRQLSWDSRKYPYLAAVKWSKGAPLTLRVQNRLQTEEALLTVAPESGETRVLHVESDAAWLKIDQSVPAWGTWEGQPAFLWRTERNGGPQLELRGADGALIRAVTPPALRYQSVAHVDWKAGHVVVSAFTPTPLDTRLVQASLKDGTTRELTTEAGSHQGVWAKGSDRWFHGHLDLEGRRTLVIRDGAGKQLAALKSLAKPPPFTPNVEFTVVGEREYNAAIVRPRNFEPGRKYPVIQYVYGGPGYRVVSHNKARYFTHQWIADHGFVVVMADARGTPGRGRSWERVTAGNVIDGPLEDQVAALKALGDKYSELDMKRVGIFGWSFGGYFTLHATTRHPEVYRAGVAGAPVADWRDYDTHYTERFMGLPQRNKDGYHRANALTWAKDLKRPLLILHGTVDDNVFLAHSVKMSDALHKAHKPHELQLLSGFTHMVYGKAPTVALYTRIADFFSRHLNGPADQ